MEWLRWVCLAQGSYFFLTALWPIVHLPSFVAVTGPKTDYWLVRTVAGLIFAASVSLLTAAFLNHIGLETLMLAVGCSVALAIIDIVYAIKRVISPIYLGDAVLEIALIVGWIRAWTP